jgi:hypothetical protein
MSTKRKLGSSEFANFITSISSILENAEDETLITELKERIEQAENILDLMKNKPRAFSSIQYNDLVKMNNTMHWDLPRDLHKIPDFRPQLIKVPEYILEIIRNELQTKTQTIGILSATNNEAKRKPFIDTFVYSCINMFQGEITNDMESYISNAKFQGRIEYILKAFSEIIIVIIEAKKDIEYQANYGQVMAELYNSYWYNESIGLASEDVYGILTTGENWQWWKYDGKKFGASTNLIELRSTDPKSLPTVTSFVYSIIINAWVQACKIYFKDNSFDKCKNEIFKARTNDEALRAFSNLTKTIHDIKERLGHSDDEWSYEADYMG